MKILKKKKSLQVNYAKFQHDCAIFEFSMLPQSFDSKLQQTNTKTDENEMPFPLYYTILSHFTFV